MRQKSSPHFMEPESPLLCSQHHAINPYDPEGPGSYPTIRRYRSPPPSAIWRHLQLEMFPATWCTSSLLWDGELIGRGWRLSWASVGTEETLPTTASHTRHGPRMRSGRNQHIFNSK